jgi:proteic killer suppression protein
MIVSFRGKRTREFAEGNRVKAFTAFEHKAEMKLDQLDSATSLLDLTYPATISKPSRATVRPIQIRINSQWRICFEGRRTRRVRSMLKSSITIEVHHGT